MVRKRKYIENALIVKFQLSVKLFGNKYDTRIENKKARVQIFEENELGEMTLTCRIEGKRSKHRVSLPSKTEQKLKSIIKWTNIAAIDGMLGRAMIAHGLMGHGFLERLRTCNLV